jgi:hypothetical protein
VLQVLPQEGAHCTYREMRYAQPDCPREMRLARYLHHRVRRQGLAADVRLLRRVQQGMPNLEGVEPGPIAASEPGLRWFAARYRERVAPASSAARTAVTRRRTRAKARPTADA